MNMSKLPIPGNPSDEKYKVLLSEWINGEISFLKVLMGFPKLTGFENSRFPVGSIFTSHFHISFPPTPPGLLLEKQQ
jgi:hypothetical protein